MTSNVTGYDFFRYYKTMILYYESKSFSIDKYGFNSRAVSENAWDKLSKQQGFYWRAANEFPKRVYAMRFCGVVLFWYRKEHITKLYDVKDPRYTDRWRAYVRFMNSPVRGIKDAFKIDDYVTKGGQLPEAVNHIIRGDDQIMLTTAFIMLTTDWARYVDSEVGSDHIVWQQLRDRMQKFTLFVRKTDAKYDSIRETLMPLIEKLNLNSNQGV